MAPLCKKMKYLQKNKRKIYHFEAKGVHPSIHRPFTYSLIINIDHRKQCCGNTKQIHLPYNGHNIKYPHSEWTTSIFVLPSCNCH